MKTSALPLVPVTLFTVFLFSCGADNRGEYAPNAKADSTSNTYAENLLKDSLASNRYTATDGSAIDDGTLRDQTKLEEDALYRSSAPGFLLPFVTTAGKLNKLDSTHRFIRTADMKFRVKNVTQATYAIEDVTAAFGGYVADTKLQSSLTYNSLTPVTADSSLSTMRYQVNNTILLRIPAQNLDTTLKMIAPLVDYLDYRNVNTQDITLDIVANKLMQARVAKYNVRVANDVQQNQNHIDIQGAENSMLNQQENSDNALIENLRMDDKVRYSTVNITIYQPETIRQELVKREKTVEAYEPGFGSQVSNSLATGWSGLRVFFAVIILLWPVWLVGLSIFFGVRYYIRKKSVN